MGQSTDAILCFGVRVENESIEAYKDSESEAVAHANAEKNPLGYMVYMGNRADIDGVTVELVQHCSSNYPEYIVAASDSRVKARRGHPQPITALETRPDWTAAIKAFCERFKVATVDTEPTWWLASDWS